MTLLSAAKNVRPERCCKIGTYDCQVPMVIRGRVAYIDYCIADIVAALNAAGIEAMTSCCGHGTEDAIISLRDGREVWIKNVKRWWNTDNKANEELIRALK